MTDRLAQVADLAVARQAQKTQRKPRRLAYKFAGQTQPHLHGQYVIKGLLPPGLAVLYGRANAGKTAVAVDVAAHVGGGLAYRDRRTRRGLVVWLALEAPESLDNRIVGWCAHHGIEAGELQVAVVTGLVDLRHKPSVAELIEVLAEIEAQAGEPILMLVCDTLARAMPGANENDGAEMGAAVASLDRIRSEARIGLVLLLHHVGKDDTKGPRGHSSLLAAVDSAFEVKDGELVVHKARDAKIGEALAFTLRGVEIGEDEDGEAVTAVVALAAGAPSGHKARAQMKLADGSKLALRVLRQLLKDEGVGVAGLDAPAGTTAVRFARWREEHRQRYGRSGADADATGAERQAWGRALQQLQAASIITVSGEWVWAHDRKA
jgi:hypothetical protein